VSKHFLKLSIFLLVLPTPVVLYSFMGVCTSHTELADTRKIYI